jgi:hypothetical protein
MLYDKKGNLLTPILRPLSPKMTFNLNGIDSCEFNLFLNDPISELLSELQTYVKVWRWMEGLTPDPGYPDFAGMVGPISETGSSNTVGVTCWSPFFQLQSRFIFALQRFGYPKKTKDPVDQGEILMGLIDYTNNRGPTGIVRGAIDATVGRRRKYDKGQSIWTAITDMTTILGGVDLEPLYVHADGDPTLMQFGCGYARGVYNPDARLDYWVGAQNCNEMTRSSNVDQGEVATYVEEDGQGQGPVPFGFDLNDDEIGNGIGLWEEIISQPNVEDQVLLKAYATEELRLKSRPQKSITATVASTLPPWYNRDFGLGDVLPVAASRGRMRFQDYLRVYAVALQRDDNGMETTQLTLARDSSGVIQGVPEPSL